MSSFLNKIFRQKTINRISKKCKLLGDYKKINVNIFLYLRIICSLFTALVLTKLLLNNAVSAGIISKLSHFRVKRGAK